MWQKTAFVLQWSKGKRVLYSNLLYILWFLLLIINWFAPGFIIIAARCRRSNTSVLKIGGPSRQIKYKQNNFFIRIFLITDLEVQKICLGPPKQQYKVLNYFQPFFRTLIISDQHLSLQLKSTAQSIESNNLLNTKLFINLSLNALGKLTQKPNSQTLMLCHTLASLYI